MPIVNAQGFELTRLQLIEEGLPLNDEMLSEIMLDTQDPATILMQVEAEADSAYEIDQPFTTQSREEYIAEYVHAVLSGES